MSAWYCFLGEDKSKIFLVESNKEVNRGLFVCQRTFGQVDLVNEAWQDVSVFDVVVVVWPEHVGWHDRCILDAMLVIVTPLSKPMMLKSDQQRSDFMKIELLVENVN